MNRNDVNEQIEDLGAVSVETQGSGGHQADSDLQPNQKTGGISND